MRKLNASIGHIAAGTEALEAQIVLLCIQFVYYS